MLWQRIHDPMDLNNFIFCTAEDDTVMEGMTATALHGEDAYYRFLFMVQDSSEYLYLE